jgi:hypothetical protein
MNYGEEQKDRSGLKRIKFQILNEHEAHALVPIIPLHVSCRHVLVYRLNQKLFVLTVILRERTGAKQKSLDSTDHFWYKR